MRLPWGLLPPILDAFRMIRPPVLVSCLSFEERCAAVPLMLAGARSRHHLVQLDCVEGAFPDYSREIERLASANEALMAGAGPVQKSRMGLLAPEDELIGLAQAVGSEAAKSVILDITSFPKRYFCFLVKQILADARVSNLLVTYTEATAYDPEHIATDPLPCDYLPGYLGPLPAKSTDDSSAQTKTLVLSVGFESFSLRSVLEQHKREIGEVHFLMPFPPDGRSTKRTWLTLMQVSESSPEMVRGHRDVVAAWDAERVFHQLEYLSQQCAGLVLAPFGPKPHTFGMALFALRHGAGMYYTQPQSYNPRYSTGIGQSWAYVAKWEGVSCLNR